MSQFDLTNRVAVVTGASQGIGAALAVGLAEAGANLVLIARGSCAATQAAIESRGRRCQVINTDLGQPDAGRAALGQISSHLGKQVDILINNAGTIRRAPLIEHSRQDWDAVMNLNLDAVFWSGLRKLSH